MMSKPTNILYLEDNPDDVELIRATLSRAPLEFRLRVTQERAGFELALGEGPFDLILSDYSLPSYDGLMAMEMARKKQPEVPFILISGRLGEEHAVDCMLRGATDYVVKSRLDRLVPAIMRALNEAEERRKRRRAEEHLEESREQLRALLARMEHLREEERTRIAREVHDVLGQLLTALKMDLALLERRLRKIADENLREAMLDRLGEILRLADTMIESVQKLSRELRPSVLDTLGLGAALQFEARQFQERSGIKCEIIPLEESASVDSDCATGIFRIFQEMLTNVARHARASNVTISFCQKKDMIQLEVTDDGRGIRPEEIASPHALGLLGMAERARLLGGQLQIRGEAVRGTTVTLTIPVRNA
jgi:signal transduction histidine kinase